jgi:L-2-hydroxyglutarate oxidase LhgO
MVTPAPKGAPKRPRRRKANTVHAVIYYLPGSAKATLCRRGAGLLRGSCAERGLPWDARGKLVVARDEAETARLREIERHATANGAPGLRWLDRPAIRELEPDITGRAALLSPSTAGGPHRRSRLVICAGLQSDLMAAAAGDRSAPEIVPFRGVHLTPRIDGEVDIGPNARRNRRGPGGGSGRVPGG